LSVALVLTRNVREAKFPLTSSDFITEGKGQVKGLGGDAVQKILKDHGISRLLAKEGGRTSRGSISNMEKYVHFLNQLFENGMLDLNQIEAWWVGQVRDFFAAFPLKLKLVSGMSVQSALDSLFEEAIKRQEESQGTMVVGSLMQHLVGAKLEVLYPDIQIDHHGASVADEPTGRPGDFFVNSCSIHVTTTPTERLMFKCQENLDAGYSGLVITTDRGVVSVDNLSENQSLTGRIDTLDIQQFLVGNLLEWSTFEAGSRHESFSKLIESYNRIIEECETDPSLKISLS